MSRRPTHVTTSCCCATGACSCSSSSSGASLYDLPRHGCPHGLDHDRGLAPVGHDVDAARQVAVRIPREADERVREVVRCRETFQREILTSRHDILQVLATRGVVLREGPNWGTPNLQWLQHLTPDGAPLAPEDRLSYRE